jgi:arsenate reductase
MIRILFLDADNGSRSQMAEAILNRMAEGNFKAYSAGMRTGYLHDVAVEVLFENGIDISQRRTKEIKEFLVPGITFQYLIILIPEKEIQMCPVLPAAIARLHWIFDDPRKFEGTDEEILGQFRALRDLMRKVTKRFLKEIEKGHSHVDADLNFEPVIR